MSTREIDFGDEYVQLPATDRNTPLSISSGLDPELDGQIKLPELPKRRGNCEDFNELGPAFCSCEPRCGRVARRSWVAPL